ncbi:SprT family zinc-dependent metalloprotease [Herbaspirillum sp. RTI4]|uniref:M48 family metallopeptidase n=1 Tax=Herbaspirillum sp. RTI4 TaxID=3048640 RepID=UPI002AB34890|nr:SprT family zinc-dependent metalloprotease [Herbaspirillum sp. RTI4]MDY7576757.1 SprT family zinc-dependent metalloprotease [Herbaspirillum sp. RTI4]MEA9981353.1 SprT family zinc-dependent metalloprotease [Herbaspirillum sp. RTI4]
MKLLRRQIQPDPNQLALQLDFFAPEPLPRDQIKPVATPPTGSIRPLLPTPPALPPAPRQTTPADGKRRIQVGEHTLDYVLLRSKRRTIGFLIGEEGLRVTAPKWVTLGEIENAIREKQRWIFTKLNERRERSVRRLQPPMEWRDGATLPFLGAELTLRLRTQPGAAITHNLASGELVVSLPTDASEQQLKDRVLGWLQQQARETFAARLPIYAEKLGVEYRSFALSSATTQWGSCTADGKIRLNWRLMHFSLPLIDYVIAHELSHLREMNHSPRFWATVQSIFPEFEDAKRALRDRGPDTLPIF